MSQDAEFEFGQESLAMGNTVQSRHGASNSWVQEQFIPSGEAPEPLMPSPSPQPPRMHSLSTPTLGPTIPATRGWWAPLQQEQCCCNDMALHPSGAGLHFHKQHLTLPLNLLKSVVKQLELVATSLLDFQNWGSDRVNDLANKGYTATNTESAPGPLSRSQKTHYRGTMQKDIKVNFQLKISLYLEIYTRKNPQKASLTQSRNSPQKDIQAKTPTHWGSTLHRTCPSQISRGISPMESAPSKTLRVATAKGKRMWQITLWVLLRPLTFHGPNQVTWSCLTSKGVGRYNPTMFQEKRRGTTCLN